MEFDLILKTCNTVWLSGALEVSLSDLFSPYTFTVRFQPVDPINFAVLSQFFRVKLLDFIITI